jgi:hypothetical protein
MKIYHHPTSNLITARHDFTIELAPGERITLPPGADVQLVEGPASPTFDDNELSLSEAGRYWLRVIESTGDRHDLKLVCFEPALLDFVAGQIRSFGHGGDIIDADKVRSVVRSLCTTSWFQGTIESTVGHSMADHGC